MENLTDKSIKLGEIILYVVKLQFFWFVSVIRLGFITGFFPSTSAVLDFLLKGFKEFDAVAGIKLAEFLKTGKKQFKEANVLGFSSLLVYLILYIDWRVSLFFIQDSVFRILLFVFSLVISTTLVYVLPCYVRYEMPLKDYFRQAFYLMLCSLPSSIAIFLGTVIVFVVLSAFPIFTLIPVPVFLLPTAWFSYQAMLRLEKKNEEMQ